MSPPYSVKKRWTRALEWSWFWPRCVSRESPAPSTSTQPLDKVGLARTLKAQFSPRTLIEQIGGDCRSAAAGHWRVYRLTLRGRQALFMQVEFAAGANAKASGTRLNLSVENKPAWAC